MPDKPAAEVPIDEPLVRRLVHAQASHLIPPDARIVHVDEGWDCSVWRVGASHAARLPRRAAAVEPTTNEQRFLGPLASRLAAAGLGAPAPVVHGVADAGYPWPWSIVPWFDGVSGTRVPRAARRGWAGPLAAGVGAVHLASDGTHPPNPVRGVPLAVRVDGVAARFAAARETHPLPVPVLAALEDAWQDALAAPEWARVPVWIHGDLHPGNVIARDDRLVALIDFGDLTAGDPAYDLATAWLTFDRSGRSAFRAALDGRYDTATWRRARGWAAAFALILLQHSDDAPGYASLARDAAAEIATEAKST